jgi:4-alpha-glucanotransferase
VHDTSTIRGWWEEDAAERELFFRTMGEKGACPARMTRDLLEKIVAYCCGAESILCMFQLQDVLDLDEALWTRDPRQERINVPGTVNDENWTWRMPLSVEELAARTGLSERIHGMAAARGARPLRGKP